MPMEDLENDEQKAYYHVLNDMVDRNHNAELAVLQWINDMCELESGDLHMDGPDDWWIEEQVIGWK